VKQVEFCIILGGTSLLIQHVSVKLFISQVVPTASQKKTAPIEL